MNKYVNKESNMRHYVNTYTYRISLLIYVRYMCAFRLYEYQTN